MVDSRTLRESHIPLPSNEDGYSRIMLVGTTGAGKTTLLRHLIGSDHRNDRFPSTSASRTTTADIEIITARDKAFTAAISFMPKSEVVSHIDECLQEACRAAVRKQVDSKIADSFLLHTEQRFRLSYVLGAWQEPQNSPSELDFTFDEMDQEASIADDESVADSEQTYNQSRLSEYVNRIKKLASESEVQTAEDVGNLEDTPTDDAEDWLQIFSEKLAENEEFQKIIQDVMSDVAKRFDWIEDGDFDRDEDDWPILWRYQESDRATFLRQVRWFSSNHNKQFGRLLTPLVNGVRVRGHFQPTGIGIQGDANLVLLDGQGLGHTSSETSVSTRVTSRFDDIDMLLLVDNAQQPMLGNPLALLQTVGSSGYVSKLAIAFTHIDLVKGDNLSTFAQIQQHVLGSVRDAAETLREPLGAVIASELNEQIESNTFFLGGLDKGQMPLSIIDQMEKMFALMQASGRPSKSVDVYQTYTWDDFDMAIRDAIEDFRGPWDGKLGVKMYDEVKKEHWTRIKALNRRFAEEWDNEYDNLRPAADVLARLQEGVSHWLDSQSEDTLNQSTEERNSAYSAIRQHVSRRLHDWIIARMSYESLADWQDAYEHRGAGSTFIRAKDIAAIYEATAPTIRATMTMQAREFRSALRQIVQEAVERTGGQIR